MQLSVQHSVQYPIAPGKVTASSLGQPKKE